MNPLLPDGDSSRLLQKPCRPDLLRGADGVRELPEVGNEAFADGVSRMLHLLEQHHVHARACKVGGRSASRRATADDDDVRPSRDGGHDAMCDASDGWRRETTTSRRKY